MNDHLLEEDGKRLVEDYIEATILNSKAAMQGNSRKANRQADIAIAARRALKKHDPALTAFHPLLMHPDPNVRSSVAVNLLDVQPTRAEEVLAEVASGEGMPAFLAQVALEEWRQGRRRPD